MRGMHDRHRRILGVSIGLSLALTGYEAYRSVGYADIRPSGTQGSARSTLRRAQAAHGGWDAFRGVAQAEYRVEGEFAYGVVRHVMTPYADNTLPLVFRYQPRTPGGTFQRVDQEEVYTVDASTPVDSTPAFFLRSIRHLLDLPFAMETATRLEDAGSVVWRGQVYDRIYATWSDEEPPRDVDQYVLWVNRTTGRIDRFDTTVRDLSRFLTGRVEYHGFRKMYGMIVPSQIIVYRAVNEQQYVHRWKITKVNFRSEGASS